MTTKVNENTIAIKSTFPLESQNSASPYHFTANKLIALLEVNAEIFCRTHTWNTVLRV